MDNKTKRTFIRFLKEWSIYEAFFCNFKLQKTDRDKISNLLTENDQYNIFNYAFTWGHTKEKHKFWCLMNAIWLGNYHNENSLDVIKSFVQGSNLVDEYTKVYNKIKDANFSQPIAKKILYGKK